VIAIGVTANTIRLYATVHPCQEEKPHQFAWQSECDKKRDHAWLWLRCLFGALTVTFGAVPANAKLIYAIECSLSWKPMLFWLVLYGLLTGLLTLGWLAWTIYVGITMELGGEQLPVDQFLVYTIPTLLGVLFMWICYAFVACYFKRLGQSSNGYELEENEQQMEPLRVTRTEDA